MNLYSFHDIEFGRRKFFIKAKSPLKPLINKLSRNAVANDQQSMYKTLPIINRIRPRLPTASKAEGRIISR